MAPVSEAGTIPILWLAGTRNILRVRSMAWPSRALPSFERCERPSDPSARCSGPQPGGFAHGPDEKKGRSGLVAGLMCGALAPAAVTSFTVDSPRREHAPRWDGVARRRP